MRILHIFDHSVPLHSGYTFRSLSILRRQRARGWHTIHLTGPKQGDIAGEVDEVEGLKFYRTKPLRGLMSSVPILRDQVLVEALYRRIITVARTENPDILHAHSPVQNAMAAVRAGKKLGLPVVYEVRAFWEDAAVAHGTFHSWGLRYPLAQWIETRAMRRADAVTTICEGLRGDMISRGIPQDKVTVIPNAVEPDAFRSARQPDATLRQELGLKGKKVLGFVGSFYGYEGLDLLIGSMPAINDDAPDVRLLIVGGGPEESKLEQQVAALDLKDLVQFVGRVPHNEVSRYYSVIDGFIYPRRRMRLTDLVTPLKPLEAMAGRKFVMASDVGGHRELIDHGINGRLFEPDSITSIAETVVAWAGEGVNIESMLDAGELLVSQTRNWEVSVAKYEDVYEHLYQMADTGNPS